MMENGEIPRTMTLLAAAMSRFSSLLVSNVCWFKINTVLFPFPDYSQKEGSAFEIEIAYTRELTIVLNGLLHIIILKVHLFPIFSLAVFTTLCFFITYPRRYTSVPWYFLQSCNQKASGAPGLVSVGKWAQQMALGVSLPPPWHPSMEGINRKEGQVREGCCCLLSPCCLSPCTHDC